MHQREADYHRTGDMFALSRKYFYKWEVSNTFSLFRTGKKKEFILYKSERTRGSYKFLKEDISEPFQHRCLEKTFV